MPDRYNVLIIGAGNIGAFFDNNKSKDILTHAHAFTSHKGYRLAGFVDKNKEKARKAALLWNTRTFFTIEEALKKEEVDVATVAVPNSEHFNVMRKLSSAGLKLVFAEKPLAMNMSEAKELLEIYSKKKIPVQLNYMRRFIPELQAIRDDIKSGSYGDFLNGTGYYGKGLLHNGSHLIDLLRFFLGELKGSSFISSISDYSKKDKTVSAVLNFGKKGKFILNALDCRLYSLFEVDLFFERKRIRIADSAFNVQAYGVIDSRVFKGYRNLALESSKATSLGKSLYYSAQNIYNHLSSGEKLKCPLYEGYKTLETCFYINDQE